MAAKQLNSRKVDTIGPGRHPDGAGLYLVVTASLTRSWQARYTSAGRRQWIGLGPAKGGHLDKLLPKPSKVQTYRTSSMSGCVARFALFFPDCSRLSLFLRLKN